MKTIHMKPRYISDKKTPSKRFRLVRMNTKTMLAGIIVLITSVVLPVSAKVVWLNCGHQLIYLDTSKGQYSLEKMGKRFEGIASILPTTITFTFIHLDDFVLGLRYTYRIDRKNLHFTRSIESMKRVIDNLGDNDTGGDTEEGVCKITTEPVTNNKI